MEESKEDMDSDIERFADTIKVDNSFDEFAVDTRHNYVNCPLNAFMDFCVGDKKQLSTRPALRRTHQKRWTAWAGRHPELFPASAIQNIWRPLEPTFLEGPGWSATYLEPADSTVDGDALADMALCLKGSGAGIGHADAGHHLPQQAMARSANGQAPKKRRKARARRRFTPPICACACHLRISGQCNCTCTAVCATRRINSTTSNFHRSQLGSRRCRCLCHEWQASKTEGPWKRRCSCDR